MLEVLEPEEGERADPEHSSETARAPCGRTRDETLPVRALSPRGLFVEHLLQSRVRTRLCLRKGLGWIQNPALHEGLRRHISALELHHAVFPDRGHPGERAVAPCFDLRFRELGRRCDAGEEARRRHLPTIAEELPVQLCGVRPALRSALGHVAQDELARGVRRVVEGVHLDRAARVPDHVSPRHPESAVFDSGGITVWRVGGVRVPHGYDFDAVRALGRQDPVHTREVAVERHRAVLGHVEVAVGQHRRLDAHLVHGILLGKRRLRRDEREQRADRGRSSEPLEDGPHVESLTATRVLSPCLTPHGFSLRSVAKNPRSSAADSASSTPEVTSNRWLSRVSS